MPVLEAPVAKGEKIELTIDNYGHEGEGVGRYQGFTIFVPGALKGEWVQVRITEVKKNFGRGEVVEVLESSPERVIPVCQVYQDCGGCQLQHLDYQGQLNLKRQTVIDAVERIGGLEDIRVHPVLGMKEPWYYRNKVQYPVGLSGNTIMMGFYRKGTHEMINGSDCLLQTMLTNWVVVRIRKLIEKFQISVYDEQTGKGLLRHVLIKKGFTTGEMMVVFITNGIEFEHGREIAAELMAAFPAVKSVIQNINFSRGNVIMGREFKILAGSLTISDELSGFKFKISARSFFQVNPAQAEVLYHKAVEYAGLAGTERVLDAYCGVGSLTLFLTHNARVVYGIEAIPEAILDAKENAVLNQIQNVRFVVGKTEEVLPQLMRDGIGFDVAVVDPPRAGCEPSVLRSFADAGVKRIVYVSCNPSTLARDLKILAELGYRTEEIQPVDMFPHTYHIECVARIERK